ncbi:hypothetical protein ABEB36_000499 [Hypothenemus hampei]|uniref:Membrane insertase YidC/Oxa/ALB C-terminal domain-containing protein n=1 Tax=Hypothenemus hampei TaxID=57062 RepID=A0ABD1FBI0_HYPHA
MSGYPRISKLKSILSYLKKGKDITKLYVWDKPIDAASNNNKSLSNSIEKIKELNQLLSVEFMASLKPKSTTARKNKVIHACSYSFENKKEQNKKKHYKPESFQKEIEKLCTKIGKSHIWTKSAVLSGVGLSLQESDWDTEFPAKVSQIAKNTHIALSNSSEYFVVKTGKYASNGTMELSTDNFGYLDTVPQIPDKIPEPPPVPSEAAEALNQLNELGEATFASLGLGGWTPVGLVQNCMEYLHVGLGLEWWQAIVLGTLIIRIALFPLVIVAQRNAAKMNNTLPQMQHLQLKMSEARQTGDAMNAARYSQELLDFMKEKGVNPLKNMLVPLAQAPIFISFFMGLRQMANVPVDSLRHGGLFWFEDLTLPDQYFLMPIITSLTLWLTIEVGTDSARISSQNAMLMKYGLRALPVIVLPFTVNFPGAILCYWVSSNFISLLQVAFLKIPSVRNYFKIQPLINYAPDQLPHKSKGFKEDLKSSWTNMKITRELEERRRLDEIQFRKAGTGPVQKTYKYDPTKQTSPNNNVPISAKKRE